MEENTGVTSYGKIYTVANFVGASVVSAFFASLERFSCINLSTADPDDDEEPNGRPLIFLNPARHDDPCHALSPPAAVSAPPPVDTLPV